MASTISITNDKLSRLIGTPRCPAVIDVRTDEDFAADPRFLPGALRRGHATVASWGSDFRGRSVVVVCQSGAKLSHGVAAWLRCGSVPAEVLEGGHEAWSAAGLPIVPEGKLPQRDERGRTVWVTRARPKVDRIACPWLIRRYVDPSAVFLFVQPSEVEAVGERFGAAPFDVENVFWSHRGERCTFDTMIEELDLATPPLLRLATLVRGADTARPDLAPEAPGLLAASLGLSRMYGDDLEQLEAGMALYDAFYRWCRDATDETQTGLPAREEPDMSDILNTGPTPKVAKIEGHGVSFSEAVRVWARIASLSFGGPAGQIALMHRILVDEKRWIGENRFLHALNYCMLLPGPEAQQLAIYVGWLMHRTKGGLVAGALFVLPGFLCIMALSWIYAAFGNVGIVEALFFGLKAAVLAIVLEAVLRIGRRALKNNVMFAIAAAAFVAIFVFDVPFPAIILAAGLIGYLGGRAGHSAFLGGGGHGPSKGAVLADADSALGDAIPDHARPNLAWALRISGVLLALWLVPVALLYLLLGSDSVFTEIAIFFSQMAVVTFGGAYAVLAYVAQQAVETYNWLAPGEMLDGLGLAETTPGPLIMVTQFVGFLGAFRDPGWLNPFLAGTLGGILTTWVTFVPCFLWIFLGAPFIEGLRSNRALSAALGTITAAVVGVILNLAVWFGLHVLFAEVVEVSGFGASLDVPILSSVDPAALMLTAAAMAAIFRFKVGVVPTLLGCAVAGAVLFLTGGAGR